MNPITRKEMILAKAAGQDVPDIEPITREEMFLKQIQCGGGGSIPKPLTSDYMPSDYPNEARVTEMINAALGVIENGSY